MLDLESEVMRGLGSIPTGDNILLLDVLFSFSKASDANIDIIANFVCTIWITIELSLLF